MKENKQDEHKQDEHKDNTGMIIGIIVIGVLLIGLLSYLMMNGKDDVKDTIDKTGDTIENITDNDQKTAADVAGSYQAKYNLNTDELDVTEDNEAYIELVLKEDGAASIVLTSQSKEPATGTFDVTNKKITVMTNNMITTNNEDNNVNQTYEFSINDDDTLSYNTDDKEVTLTKTNNDNLKYIK